jgi:hypothetical protein
MARRTAGGRAGSKGEDMVCWPASAHVGNVKNNAPSLIEPILVA